MRRPGILRRSGITRTKGNEILTGRVRRSIATGIKKTNLLDPIANTAQEKERERDKRAEAARILRIGLNWPPKRSLLDVSRLRLDD